MFRTYNIGFMLGAIHPPTELRGWPRRPACANQRSGEGWTSVATLHNHWGGKNWPRCPALPPCTGLNRDPIDCRWILDVCVFVQGVKPANIQWICSNDVWYLNRDNIVKDGGMQVRKFNFHGCLLSGFPTSATKWKNQALKRIWT